MAHAIIGGPVARLAPDVVRPGPGAFGSTFNVGDRNGPIGSASRALVCVASDRARAEAIPMQARA